MKMYAIRKLALGYTLGNSLDFIKVPGLDKEKVAVKCNKEMQELLQSINYYPYKGTQIKNTDIPNLEAKLKNLNITKASTQALAKTLLSFMNVCIDKGYDIRFW